MSACRCHRRMFAMMHLRNFGQVSIEEVRQWWSVRLSKFRSCQQQWRVSVENGRQLELRTPCEKFLATPLINWLSIIKHNRDDPPGSVYTWHIWSDRVEFLPNWTVVCWISFRFFCSQLAELEQIRMRWHWSSSTYVVMRRSSSKLHVRNFWFLSDSRVNCAEIHYDWIKLFFFVKGGYIGSSYVMWASVIRKIMHAVFPNKKTRHS